MENTSVTETPIPSANSIHFNTQAFSISELAIAINYINKVGIRGYLPITNPIAEQLIKEDESRINRVLTVVSLSDQDHVEINEEHLQHDDYLGYQPDIIWNSGAKVLQSLAFTAFSTKAPKLIDIKGLIYILTHVKSKIACKALAKVLTIEQIGQLITFLIPQEAQKSSPQTFMRDNTLASALAKEEYLLALGQESTLEKFIISFCNQVETLVFADFKRNTNENEYVPSPETASQLAQITISFLGALTHAGYLQLLPEVIQIRCQSFVPSLIKKYARNDEQKAGINDTCKMLIGGYLYLRVHGQLFTNFRKKLSQRYSDPKLIAAINKMIVYTLNDPNMQLSNQLGKSTQIKNTPNLIYSGNSINWESSLAKLNHKPELTFQNLFKEFISIEVNKQLENARKLIGELVTSEFQFIPLVGTGNKELDPSIRIKLQKNSKHSLARMSEIINAFDPREEVLYKYKRKAFDLIKNGYENEGVIDFIIKLESEICENLKLNKDETEFFLFSDFTEIFDEGWSLLALAAARGMQEMLKIMLSRINHKNLSNAFKQLTHLKALLYHAAESRNEKTFNLVFKIALTLPNKAEILNITNGEDGYTLAHLAILQNNMSLLKMFIKEGGNINQMSIPYKNKPISPLALALKHNKASKMISSLLANGAIPRGKDIDLLIECKFVKTEKEISQLKRNLADAMSKANALETFIENGSLSEVEASLNNLVIKLNKIEDAVTRKQEIINCKGCYRNLSDEEIKKITQENTRNFVSPRIRSNSSPLPRLGLGIFSKRKNSTGSSYKALTNESVLIIDTIFNGTKKVSEINSALFNHAEFTCKYILEKIEKALREKTSTETGLSDIIIKTSEILATNYTHTRYYYDFINGLHKILSNTKNNQLESVIFKIENNFCLNHIANAFTATQSSIDSIQRIELIQLACNSNPSLAIRKLPIFIAQEIPNKNNTAFLVKVIQVALSTFSSNYPEENFAKEFLIKIKTLDFSAAPDLKEIISQLDVTLSQNTTKLSPA